MKKQMFEELLGSVREAGAILRGEKKAARRTVLRASSIRSIRTAIRDQGHSPELGARGQSRTPHWLS